MIERIKAFFRRTDPDDKLHTEFETTKKRIAKLHYKRNYIRAVLYKHPEEHKLLAEEVFALSEELLNYKDYKDIKNDAMKKARLHKFSEKLNELRDIIGYE